MGKTRLYVGNLPSGVRERDIEDIFHKYGKIANLDLRTNKGPPFAFLDFDDSSAAKDAISGRDGYDCKGRKIRVEYSHADRDGDRRSGGGGGGYSDRRGYGDRNGDRGFGGGGGRRDGGGGGGGLRRSKYRIIITGLPRSGSWQDLKDHFREAGDVCFADVTKDGTGHVEFFREDDMKYAIKKLDDTKFRARDGETGYIRIKADDGSSSSSRRRSRSASGDRDRRTRSRSPISRPARGGGGGGGGDSADETNGKDRSSSKRERTSSRSPKRTRAARGGASPDDTNGKSRSSRRSRSPITRAARGSASPDEANGKDKAKRERSASHSPKHSEHSKSRSPSKSAGSRSASRERE